MDNNNLGKQIFILEKIINIHEEDSKVKRDGFEMYKKETCSVRCQLPLLNVNPPPLNSRVFLLVFLMSKVLRLIK